MIVNKNGVIERIVRTKIGISELSRILHVSRTSIYNWFEQEHLSIDIVCKIGHAIDHDFANEFPEEFAKAGNQIMADLISGKLNQQTQYNNSVQYWMNKYISLLEKHNELLSQMKTGADNRAEDEGPEGNSGTGASSSGPSRNYNMNAHKLDNRNHNMSYF